MSPPTREQLRVTFELYNARYFGDRLRTPALHRVASAAIYGDCTEPCAGFPAGRIRISTRIAAPRAGWRGILLHEMIHHALIARGHARTMPHDATNAEWHDAAFTREANRLGRRLGLPRVAQSDAWAWPWGGMVARDLHDLFD